MPKFIEMNPDVSLSDQLGDGGGPAILINTFVVPAGDADALLAA